MILAWLLLSRAEAGAWTRELGSAYARVGADVYVTTHYEAPATFVPGSIVAEGQGANSYVGQSYSVYGEAGLAHAWRLQLTGSVPVTVGRVGFEQDSLAGPLIGRATVVRAGDAHAGAQIALHPKLPLAASVDVKLPLYRNDSVCAGNPYSDYCPRPGEDQVDVTYAAHAGGTALKGDFFAEGTAGYRYRSTWFLGWETDKIFADALVTAATAGYRTGPALWMLKADGSFNVKPDPDSATAVRVGPAALVDVGHDGFALEARFQADVWARNTSTGVGFGAGASWRH